MADYNAPSLQERIRALETYIGISDICSVSPSGSSSCPACGKKNKFSVWENKTAKCWSNHCTLNEENGKPYSVVTLYRVLNNLPKDGKGFFQALLELEKRAGISYSDYKVKDERSEFLQTCLDLYSWALWSSEGKEALAYLKDRGFSEEIIQEHKIGYAPTAYFLRGFEEIDPTKLKEEKLLSYKKEYFDNRLVFPIRDIKGDLVHFVGRYLGEVPKNEEGEDLIPRYKDTQPVKNIPGTKAYLAFEHLIPAYLQSGVKTLFIAEGYPDTLSLIQRGFHAVGLLGLEKLTSHSDKLKKFDSIVAVFDNDFYPKSHPKYPLEYKSWRKIIPQLIEIQRTLPQTNIQTWMVPEGEGVKDINDWLNKNNHLSQGEIKKIIESGKRNLVLQLIKKWGNDISKHKILLELISITSIGKDELEKYITYVNPLEYALEVIQNAE